MAPTMLQILRPLPNHLNAAFTIGNTPADRHGLHYPAVPFTGDQLVDLRRLRKWLGRRLKCPMPVDSQVTWSDIDDHIVPVNVILANLLRFVENICWGPINREFYDRSLLAAQIVVQLTNELGFCDECHYHFELVCRTLNLIGELAPRTSLHAMLEQLMRLVVHWFSTVRVDAWDPLKQVALDNVFRVLSRSTKAKAAQWVRLTNLSYAILDALAVPCNGPQLSFLTQILWTRPSLLDRQPLKALPLSVRPPNYASIFDWFTSQRPAKQVTDQMVGDFVINLYDRQHRVRVEAVIQLTCLSCFSHERVVQSLSTIQNAVFAPRFMARSMHTKLHELGAILEKQRTLLGLPPSRRVSHFRMWVREYDPAGPLDES